MANSDMHLLFIPENILNIASLIAAEREKIAESVSSIHAKAQAMKSFWSSDSSELYMAKEETIKINGEDILDKLSSYIKDLRDVSGIYTAGETDAKTKAEALPTDGVFLV